MRLLNGSSRIMLSTLPQRQSFVPLNSNLESRSRASYVEGQRTKVNEPLFYKNLTNIRPNQRTVSY